MIVLRSTSLIALVDSAHGAEILELVDVETGSQLLGRPPYQPTAPRDGDLDEGTWTAAYRGGWQVVAPNAGNACSVQGARHGFHGAASVGRWTVAEAHEATLRALWAGHGLEAERVISLNGRSVSVETEWTAAGDAAPMVAVEHVVFGQRFIVPEVEIVLPAGLAYELSESEGPVHTPEGTARWPELTLLDGGTERADRWPAETARARQAVVADVPEGRAEIRSPTTGWAAELEWDATALPHVWIWHEIRGSGWLWRRQAELLGIEPASVPHSLGLERAVREDQATWVEPGRPYRTWVRLTIRPPVAAG